MQTIVVDCISIVDPQLAAVVRYDAEDEMPRPINSHPASPAHGKMITTGKSRPPTTCVLVIYNMFPACHLRPATIEILASTALTKVKCILSEVTMTILRVPRLIATCTHKNPSVSGITPPVPE
jgi:hypothetical protein